MTKRAWASERVPQTLEQCINDLRMYQRNGYEWMGDAADWLERLRDTLTAVQGDLKDLADDLGGGFDAPYAVIEALVQIDRTLKDPPTDL